MKTQVQLIKENRIELDAKFARDYPEGRFTIQRRSGDFKGDFWPKDKPDFYAIHWNRRRPTSHCHYRGISIEICGRKMQNHKYQSDSFGKCTHYASIGALMVGCGRLNVPIELQVEFDERYVDRDDEGF